MKTTTPGNAADIHIYIQGLLWGTAITIPVLKQSKAAGGVYLKFYSIT